jgi:hypothetical protein
MMFPVSSLLLYQSYDTTEHQYRFPTTGISSHNRNIFANDYFLPSKATNRPHPDNNSSGFEQEQQDQSVLLPVAVNPSSQVQ